MMHHTFGGFFDHTTDLTDQEKLALRLRHKVHEKLGHSGHVPAKKNLSMRVILTLVALLLLFSGLCFAESTFVTIIGTVQDPSSSAICATQINSSATSGELSALQTAENGVNRNGETALRIDF